MNKPAEFSTVLEKLARSGLPDVFNTIAEDLFNGCTRGQAIRLFFESADPRAYPVRTLGLSTRAVNKVITRIGWDITWRNISPTFVSQKPRFVEFTAKNPVSERPASIEVVLASLGDHEPWEERVAVSLYNGDTLSQAKDIVGRGTSKIKHVAAKIDWNPTWRRISHRDAYQVERKQDRLGVKGKVILYADTVSKLYTEGHTLQEIGDMAGVSRERVRQVLESLGVNLVQRTMTKRRSEKLVKRLADRKASQEKRQADRRAHYLAVAAPLLEMYAAGVRFSVISEKLGKPVGTLAAYLSYGRRQGWHSLVRQRVRQPGEPRSPRDSQYVPQSGVTPEQAEQRRTAWRVCHINRVRRYTFILTQLTDEERAKLPDLCPRDSVRVFKDQDPARFQAMYQKAVETVG